MSAEPAIKRTVAFVDGQNLFHAAREAFGCTYPNFEPLALATNVCQGQGWQLAQTRFYTGVPDATDNAFWNHFWVAKNGAMGHREIHVYSRPLRYRNKTVTLPGGASHSFLVAEEKGIDVRIALDVIRLAHRTAFDVALIFSQELLHRAIAGSLTCSCLLSGPGDGRVKGRSTAAARPVRISR